MSVARVRGGLPDHIVYWVSVIGVCNISALAAVALLWIRAHWRVALPRVISSIVAPVAALAFVLVAAGDGAHRFQRARQLAIRHQDEPSPTASLAQATRQMLARAHVRAPRVFLAGDSWAETTGIVLQLYKKDYPVRVPRGTAWTYGGAMIVERGDEDLDVIVADVDARRQLSQRPGDCMLDEHGHSVHVLALPPERFVGVTCER